MDNFDLRKYLAEGRLLKEEQLFADFKGGSDNSLKTRFARTMSDELHSFGPSSNMTISGLFSDGEMRNVQDGDDFYAGPTESLEIFNSLPEQFIITNNIDNEETFYITKNGGENFSARIKEPDQEDWEDPDMDDDYYDMVSDVGESKEVKEEIGSSELLDFIQNNSEEVAAQVGNIITDIDIDEEGDVGARDIDGFGGFAFRYPEDVDDEFVGEDGDSPRPIEVAGRKLLYIAYNI